MECTPNFWGRLSLTRTVKDIKKKPILQDRCQGPVILIKTSCPWGGGRIFFGGNGESLFLEGMVKIFGGNLWSKSFFGWGGRSTFPPASPQNTQGEELAQYLTYSAGELYTSLQNYPKKALFCYPNLLISINANHITIQNTQKQSC